MFNIQHIFPYCLSPVNYQGCFSAQLLQLVCLFIVLSPLSSVCFFINFLSISLFWFFLLRPVLGSPRNFDTPLFYIRKWPPEHYLITSFGGQKCQWIVTPTNTPVSKSRCCAAKREKKKQIPHPGTVLGRWNKTKAKRRAQAGMRRLIKICQWSDSVGQRVGRREGGGIVWISLCSYRMGHRTGAQVDEGLPPNRNLYSFNLARTLEAWTDFCIRQLLSFQSNSCYPFKTHTHTSPWPSCQGADRWSCTGNGPCWQSLGILIYQSKKNCCAWKKDLSSRTNPHNHGAISRTWKMQN